MKAGLAEPLVRGDQLPGVKVTPLKVFSDSRGWLAEIFRADEIDDAAEVPVMGYVSVTLPGVVRGPHEHRAQTDWFCFMGPSRFRVTMWDARPDSPAFGRRMVVECGEGRPAVVMVPPGVIHAYRNIGLVEGMVFNCPNQLYAGKGRKEPVDEIRHEDSPGSKYQPE